MRHLPSVTVFLAAACMFPSARSMDATAASAREVPPATASNAVDTAFQRLSGLEGEWAMTDNPGSPLRIRFYPTAGGSTLVEEWVVGDKRHSLTVYHRDNDTLIATHYCPQGNQPRLALIRNGSTDTLAFSFRDATDLGDGESALHDLGFDLSDPGRIIRTETYRSGEQVKPSSLTLARVEGAG